MAKSLIDSVLDSIFDEKWAGRRGEKLTERQLKWVSLFGRKGKTLRNLYIPKENGQTSEIDVIYITQKGIFVFESKNYSGWIYGDEKSLYWTAVLPNRQKNRFYNPIMQNRTHIKWLGAYLEQKVPLISIIVFSERCELKKVPDQPGNVCVIKRDKTYFTVKSIWDKLPDVLSENEVEDLFALLKPLTDVDESVKALHIRNIRGKYESGSGADSPGQQRVSGDTQQNELIHSDDTSADKAVSLSLICPRCGKELILRTAGKGSNIGKQFYGCSGFPKCRFIKQI